MNERARSKCLICGLGATLMVVGCDRSDETHESESTEPGTSGSTSICDESTDECEDVDAPLATPAADRGSAEPPPEQATPSSAFPFADPDTIATGSRYVTYGTTSALGVGDCGKPVWGAKYYVPYMVHGSGEATSFGVCTDADSGDAMPAGPGAWAEKSRGVWAPSVVHHGGRFILFYAASKKGTLTAARCSQTQGTNHSYFGYQPSATSPEKGLPYNKLGPGGMSLFRTFGGKARVVWHYIDNESAAPPRHSIIGELLFSGGEWTVQ